VNAAPARIAPKATNPGRLGGNATSINESGKKIRSPGLRTEKTIAAIASPATTPQPRPGFCSTSYPAYPLMNGSSAR